MTFSASNWITAADLDFTQQTTQTLSGDGTYTIGGYSWTKINSANESSSTVLTNGTGIVWHPASTSDIVNATLTLPALRLPFSNVINGFTLNTPLRLWLYNSADNAAANFDNCVMSVENPSSPTSVYVKRGFFGAAATLYISSTFAGTGGTQLGITGVYSNNVLVMEMPRGILGFDMRYSAGVYSNGFPAASSLLSIGNYVGSTGTYQTNSAIGQASNWNILLGCHRAGSTTTTYSTTMARLKVEYKL